MTYLLFGMAIASLFISIDSYINIIIKSIINKNKPNTTFPYIMITIVGSILSCLFVEYIIPIIKYYYILAI